MKHMRDSGPPTTRFHPQLTWLPPEPLKPGERYMRGGITELVSEPVSPLFETLGLPAFEQAIKEHQQRLGLGPAMQGWGFTTINGYVYGRVRISFKMMWEAICHLPQLLGQAALVSEMADAWERETLPAYRQAVDALRGDAAGFLAGELLGRMEALALVCARYWAVFAAMAPQLDRAERRFETFYRWLRRRGDPEAPVFLRGLENRLLEADRALYAACDGDLEHYVVEYGHVLYSLDFASALAGEGSERHARAALEMMRRAWAKGAPAPDGRHAALAAERETATQCLRMRLPAWLRGRFDEVLTKAQRAAQLRENALFDLGLAWVPLRHYALELGRRLAQAGVLVSSEQVFWLQHGELQGLARQLDAGDCSLPVLAERAEARWRDREAVRGARVPFTVPERKVKGFMQAFVPTAEARRQVGGNVLTGTGASPGQVTGVARVIADPEGFSRLGRGEILVAKATTPAWTPLFALAGGLVADLGGALSHGSIVAREYGIPAVMGTGNATERIRDGQVISVDGTAGKVYL